MSTRHLPNRVTCLAVAITIYFGLTACGPKLLPEPAFGPETPDWVMAGSGECGDGKGLCAVGLVAGVSNRDMARDLSDKRARKEMEKLLADDLKTKMLMRAPLGFPMDQALALAKKGLLPEVRIAKRWVDPSDKSTYAQARLDGDMSRAAQLAFDQVDREWRKKQEAVAFKKTSQPEPSVVKPEAKGSIAFKKPGHRPIVAVFGIEAKRLKMRGQKQFLDGLTDYLVMRLAESKKFQIVPRSALKQRLLQSKRETHKECYDQSCQIELGKEMAAEMTLASQIVKLGSRCTVSLGLYDLRRAATEDAATASAKNCSEDSLAGALDKALLKLTSGR